MQHRFDRRAQDTCQAATMEAVITKLFDEAPPSAGVANDAPKSFMCQVILRGGSHIQGMLFQQNVASESDRTTYHSLRMLSQAQIQDPTTSRRVDAVAEHYFDYSDVVCITLVKPVEKSNVIGIG